MRNFAYDVIEASHCSLSLVRQCEPSGQTQSDRGCREVSPDRLFFSNDSSRLSDYAQRAGERQARQRIGQ